MTNLIKGQAATRNGETLLLILARLINKELKHSKKLGKLLYKFRTDPYYSFEQLENEVEKIAQELVEVIRNLE